MTWRLWLDDQLADPDPDLRARWTPEGFLGATSSDEARLLVEAHGPPMFMDLDHDLGGDDTAMRFLNWLFYEFGCVNPPEFEIHSENCIGRENIKAFMSSWGRSLLLV
jgi:hypothetical protein